VYTASAGVPMIYDVGLALFLIHIIRSSKHPIHTHLIATPCSAVDARWMGRSAHHILEHVFQLSHTPRVILPHTLDRFQHLNDLAEEVIVPTFPRSSGTHGAGRLGGGAEAVERALEGDRFLKAVKGVWEDHTGSGTVRSAAPREGGHDDFFSEIVQMLRYQILDSLVQLVAICLVSRDIIPLPDHHVRLKRTMLYASTSPADSRSSSKTRR
jgi:hypothetical protein